MTYNLEYIIKYVETDGCHNGCDMIKKHFNM